MPVVWCVRQAALILESTSSTCTRPRYHTCTRPHCRTCTRVSPLPLYEAHPIPCLSSQEQSSFPGLPGPEAALTSGFHTAVSSSDPVQRLRSGSTAALSPGLWIGAPRACPVYLKGLQKWDTFLHVDRFLGLLLPPAPEVNEHIQVGSVAPRGGTDLGRVEIGPLGRKWMLLEQRSRRCGGELTQGSRLLACLWDPGLCLQVLVHFLQI